MRGGRAIVGSKTGTNAGKFSLFKYRFVDTKFKIKTIPLNIALMATGASSSSSSAALEQKEGEEFVYGAESGWVEARTSCDHLNVLSSDLSHVPTPDTPCTRCLNPAENWLCLSCKDVLCSRFVNKHMLKHYQESGHCLALSYSDLSVWCFSCDAYLDVQAIFQLRPVYETIYLLKFGEAPPFRTIEHLQVENI